MTSTQTLASQAPFGSKPKSLHLSDQNEHQLSNSKQIGGIETLSRLVSQQTTRDSSVTRRSLRSHDHSEQGSQRGNMTPTGDNSRKSNSSPQTFSENGMSTKTNLQSRLATEHHNGSAEASSEKSPRGYEGPKSRKASEDISSYNTRRQSKAAEQAMETESSKSLSDSKKSIGEIMTNKQTGGYHLRRTGHKSGNKDSSYADPYQYEFPGRNPSSNEVSINQSSNLRIRTTRGTASINDEYANHSVDEMASQKGGSGQKSGGSRRGKQSSVQSMLCSEEISVYEFSTEHSEKRRTSERYTKETYEIEDSQLKCTEELEDMKNGTNMREESTQGEKIKSPPGSRSENLRRRGKKCLNKLCLTSPNNPLLWSKEKILGSSICNACFEAYSNEQFCYFCHQIYLDDNKSTLDDEKDWIGCDSCGVWNHIPCEEASGIKGLSTLVKNKNYKYFCPRCRGSKSQKNVKIQLETLEVPTTTSRGNTSPKQSHPPTPKKGQTIKNGHTRPLDDWLACEEGLEEPALNKVRVSNDRKGNTVEASVMGDEDRIDDEEEDITKKKLDSLFSRSNGRRRIQQWKPPTNVSESFMELDKLLIQYGGKRAQLNEQDIKSDLNKIRELTKSKNNESQANRDGNDSDVDAMEDSISEATSALESEGNSKSVRISKVQKKTVARAKDKMTMNFTQQIVVKEEKNLRKREVSKEVKRNTTVTIKNAPGMQLRRRK